MRGCKARVQNKKCQCKSCEVGLDQEREPTELGTGCKTPFDLFRGRVHPPDNEDQNDYQKVFVQISLNVFQLHISFMDALNIEMNAYLFK